MYEIEGGESVSADVGVGVYPYPPRGLGDRFVVDLDAKCSEDVRRAEPTEEVEEVEECADDAAACDDATALLERSLLGGGCVMGSNEKSASFVWSLEGDDLSMPIEMTRLRMPSAIRVRRNIIK